jgi:hypothetical protein
MSSINYPKTDAGLLLSGHVTGTCISYCQRGGKSRDDHLRELQPVPINHTSALALAVGYCELPSRHDALRRGAQRTRIFQCYGYWVVDALSVREVSRPLLIRTRCSEC